MLWGERTSVIGKQIPITCVTKLSSHKRASFSANHSAVFHPIHQITEFCQTTVRMTVVDPCPTRRPTGPLSLTLLLWRNRVPHVRKETRLCDWLKYPHNCRCPTGLLQRREPEPSQSQHSFLFLSIGATRTCRITVLRPR